MTAPRTLPALRAAVARVLQARGEAADALVCEARRAPRGYPGGRPWYARTSALRESTGAPPSWGNDMWGATEADAIALAWGRLDADVSAQVRCLEGNLRSIEGRLSSARAALAVAREIGGEE